MSEWITPKTDWYGETVNGIYTGDRFNAKDFNRIKNNLSYLRELGESVYNNTIAIYSIDDKTVSDYLYADDINRLERNFTYINQRTLKKDYGTAPTYYANGLTMDYNELNRLESAMLDLYVLLTGALRTGRMFTWNFGTQGGVL